jgi:hypothetical protein
MALCSTVHLPQSVLDLGTVKRPLVVCLVGYVWLSELYSSILNRTLATFSLSTLVVMKSICHHLSMMKELTRVLFYVYIVCCLGLSAAFLYKHFVTSADVKRASNLIDCFSKQTFCFL